jgi:hypothetical protein
MMSPNRTTGLDAGIRIAVTRGNRRMLISRLTGAAGTYKRLLGEQRNGLPGRAGPLFLESGPFIVAGTGGADVGPFAVPLPAPEPFVWENRDSVGTVDRRSGLTLRWKPLSLEGAVLIALTAFDPSGSAWGACYCAAAGASGSFTIPSAMLANLPAGQTQPTVPAPSLGLSYLPFRNQRTFEAHGLDNGLAISLFVQVLEVQVR